MNSATKAAILKAAQVARENTDLGEAELLDRIAWGDDLFFIEVQGKEITVNDLPAGKYAIVNNNR